MCNVPVFLTAYDPAELPSGSVDPRGFTPAVTLPWPSAPRPHCAIIIP
jgi:hypothetical protein